MPRAPGRTSESSVSRRAVSLGMLLLVMAAVLASLKWFDTTSWARWQAEQLRWNYASHVLMIAVAAVALFSLKRSRADYGLTSQHPARELKLGLLCAIPLAILPLALEASLGKLTLESRVAEFWPSTLVFQVLFVGFGEELFFRGFLQSEGNHILGRPLQIGAVRFGASLFLTALLFGIGHWLGPYNPLLNRVAVNWSALLFTTLSGLVLGFARELTGSLLTAALIHVGANVYPVLFVNRPAGGAGMALGWGLVVGILIFAANSKASSANPTAR